MGTMQNDNLALEHLQCSYKVYPQKDKAMIIQKVTKSHNFHEENQALF